MRGEPRQHFEPRFSNYTRIGSRLLAEDGTTLAASAATGATAHQPGIDDTIADTGGALRVVKAIALRPGTTLQGFRGFHEVISRQTYGINSPKPILLTGAYFLKLSELPWDWQAVFADIDRAPTAAFPLSTSLTASLFREVYNHHFAQIEYRISSEESQETQALLPPLVDTVEIVGDDTMALSYGEYIELVTGYPLKVSGAMSLGSHLAPMNLAFTTLMNETPVADASSPIDVYGKFVARRNFGWNKNLIAVEPSFLIFVAGIWEEPNNQTLYGLMNPAGSDFDQVRYQGNSASSSVLDRGTPPAFEDFRNSSMWLANPAVVDPIGRLGTAGSEDRAAINYWMNGEVLFDYDHDPYVLQSNSDGDGVVRVDEGTEGANAYVCNDKFFVGMSILQHFPDA